MSIRKYIFVFLAISISLHPIFASEQQRAPFIHFPQSIPKGIFHYSFGASLTLIPRAIAEEEIRQIPMIDFKMRYGLPSNFSFYSHFSTVYISNVATAGLWWSHSWSNVSFAVSDEFSYWFGVADMRGFDTKAMGLLNRPGVSVGVDIDSYKLSTKTEALILISQHTFFGSASVGRIKPELAGIVISTSLEQKLWNKTFLSLSLQINYAKPNYQTWLAFSVQDKWMVFPELQVALLF